MSTTTHALTVGNVTIHEYNGLYSLNDLHRASGDDDKHRPAFFLRNEQTKALIDEISRCADLHINPVEVVRGRGKVQGTYACRELVIAYAAWISAAFQLKVIRVFLDAAATEKSEQPTPSLPSHAAEHAYSLAAQTASAVSAQVFHEEPNRLENPGRFTKATLVDPRAVILTPEEIADEIKRGEVGAYFNQHELMQLAQATLERIKHHMDKSAHVQTPTANNVVPLRKPIPPSGDTHTMAA